MDMHFLISVKIAGRIIIRAAQPGEKQLDLWFDITRGGAETFPVFHRQSVSGGMIIAIEFASLRIVNSVIVFSTADLADNIHILSVIKDLGSIDASYIKLRISFSAKVILRIAVIIIKGSADVPAGSQFMIRPDLRAPETVG